MPSSVFLVDKDSKTHLGDFQAINQAIKWDREEKVNAFFNLSTPLEPLPKVNIGADLGDLWLFPKEGYSVEITLKDVPGNPDATYGLHEALCLRTNNGSLMIHAENWYYEPSKQIL